VSIPHTLDAAHRRVLVGDEPMIFHCHHYNAFLQRSILDATYLDSAPVLRGAAAEVAHAQLSKLFQAGPVAGEAERKELASSLFRWAGFGTLDLGPLNAEGGSTSTASSHYAFAFKVKWEGSKTPVCPFAAGWLAGAVAAIYDQPLGSYAVSEDSCMACGAERCAFTLTRGEANYPTFTSVAAGPLTDHAPRDVPANNVDYEGIFGALTGMEIAGNDEGMIPAFGVYLTRHYANYYNRISFEFERAMIAKAGQDGQRVAEPLLIEAGHVCAFNTFGGIMTSSEWDALIRPSLKSKEDWVHGMVAAVNALGWGRWQVTRVSKQEAEFVLHDDYESVGYLGMYGKADHPVSYLAEGGVTGVMDLVYQGDIEDKPELTPAFYDRLFKSDDSYKAERLTSQAMGDPVTTFRVYRA
jgi:V4R domain